MLGTSGKQWGCNASTCERVSAREQAAAGTRLSQMEMWTRKRVW